MSKKVFRTPPAPVRRLLRKEVNFGCPVDGCGAPYLSYHHFDPPWHERNEHNPDGMIALCLHHHKSADQGAFSDDQLRFMKKNPFLKIYGKIKGKIDFTDPNIALLIGGNLCFNIQTIIESAKYGKIIWFTFNEQGNQLLNIDLKDSNQRQIFKMEDNDWITYPHVNDLECSCSNHRLKLSTLDKSVLLEMKFIRLKKKTLEKYCQDMPFYKNYFKEGMVVCELTGRIVWPLKMELTPKHIYYPDIEVDWSDNWSDNSMIGGGVALYLE